jgi:hypothetical protein
LKDLMIGSAGTNALQGSKALQGRMLYRERRLCREAKRGRKALRGRMLCGNEGSVGKHKGDARLCREAKAMQGRMLCKEAKRRIREHIREVEKPNDWTSVLLAWAGFVGSLDLA